MSTLCVVLLAFVITLNTVNAAAHVNSLYFEVGLLLKEVL